MWTDSSTLLLVLATLSPLVSAYPNGVPEGSCQDMSPKGNGHGNARPQTSLLPYVLDMEDDEETGSKVRFITIRQGAEGPFKGFMVQARSANSIIPRGTFSIHHGDNQVQTFTCVNSSDSAGHTNPEPKSKVSLMWTPPLDHKGRITVYVTVLKEADIFWVLQDVGSVELE